MARYSAEGNHATGAKDNHAVFIEQGSNLRRFKTYDLTVGASVSPVDNAAEYSLFRATGGTPLGATPTVVALDPADVATESVPLAALTSVDAEPTGRTSMVNFPLNQRATFRWVASPGSELITPATSNAGFGMTKLFTSSAFAYECVVLWEE